MEMGNCKECNMQDCKDRMQNKQEENREVTEAIYIIRKILEPGTFLYLTDEEKLIFSEYSYKAKRYTLEEAKDIQTVLERKGTGDIEIRDYRKP